MAVSVSMGGVDVGDAEIDGAIERFEGLVLVLIHEEPAARAKAEDWHFDAGTAERDLVESVRYWRQWIAD